MRVAVLGTGSRGNAVALAAGGDTVLLDAGFGVRSLERRAREAGVDLATLRAILLTHEHGDHARGAARLAACTGAPVYASSGTLRALEGRLDGVVTRRIVPHETFAVAGFTVTSAPTVHDAAEPLALLLRAGTGGPSVGLAYDLGRPTQGVRFLLSRATCLILEANHDEVLLRRGPYPAAVRARIAGPGGHLSNRDAAELVAELCHPELRAVVLAHVSDQCNTVELAERTVRTALERRRFRGQLFVAGQREPLRPFDLVVSQYLLEGLA